jgi:dGTPase
MDEWLSSWDGSRRDQGRLKDLTSQLIGRFAGAATRATRQAAGLRELVRFGADVVVPEEIRAEIAVLKGTVAAFVMSKNTRQPIYAHQREMLTELADTLLEHGPAELDPGFADDWDRAAEPAARKRAVVDQVASLTDQSAIAWYERLVRR